MNNLVNDIQTQLNHNDRKQQSLKQIILQELTNQPFCGQFLVYQLFEESSSPDELLITKALKNCTDFDFISFMNQEEVYDADEYFDVNKQLALREKLGSHNLQGLLQKVISKCTNLSKKYNLQEYIRQANNSLLDLAKDPRCTEEEFLEAANKLKVETGYDVWTRMIQVRGSDDIVKLQPNKSVFKDKSGKDRESYTLKLIRNNGMSNRDDSMEFGDCSSLSQTTEKWNPLTFAVYSGNLPLIKFIISRSSGHLRKMLKIPGIFKTQEISRLFPFIMAIRYNN